MTPSHEVLPCHDRSSPAFSPCFDIICFRAFYHHPALFVYGFPLARLGYGMQASSPFRHMARVVRAHTLVRPLSCVLSSPHSPFSPLSPRSIACLVELSGRVQLLLLFFPVLFPITSPFPSQPPFSFRPYLALCSIGHARVRLLTRLASVSRGHPFAMYAGLRSHPR